MEQKKFMDISRIKQDTEFMTSNTNGFEVGDLIVIQEKVDGSNVSMVYDTETDRLMAFSRKKELSYNMTLNGFWNWVQTLDVGLFRKYPDYVFFGEWLCSHLVKYIPEAYKKFYFYDVYDKKNECYLSQTEVKRLADEIGFTYVKTHYVGEFISWEHCKSFMDKSDIAIGMPEGIVVKNQSKLNYPNSRTPFVLKLVNKEFAEIQKSKIRVDDPVKVAEKNRVKMIVEQIVTRNRIQKELHKMIDEGVLPENLDASDMITIARTLPKRIYEDCIKEEKELVDACGEHFGKMCGQLSMVYARNIILNT